MSSYIVTPKYLYSDVKVLQENALSGNPSIDRGVILHNFEACRSLFVFRECLCKTTIIYKIYIQSWHMELDHPMNQFKPVMYKDFFTY